MIKACIMVVEDEAITATDIESRLGRLGYNVVAVASSGAQAVDKASELHPDLILMDIRLKGSMDGVRAATEIRSRMNVPITYLTAYADDETLERAQSTAPYGFLVKPFDERELHATIQMALYRHRVERQVAEASEMLEAVNESMLCLTPAEERTLRLRFGVGVSPQPTPKGSDGEEAKAAGNANDAEDLVAHRALSRLRAYSSDPRPTQRGHRHRPH